MSRGDLFMIKWNGPTLARGTHSIFACLDLGAAARAERWHSEAYPRRGRRGPTAHRAGRTRLAAGLCRGYCFVTVAQREAIRGKQFAARHLSCYAAHSLLMP